MESNKRSNLIMNGIVDGLNEYKDECLLGSASLCWYFAAAAAQDCPAVIAWVSSAPVIVKQCIGIKWDAHYC